MKAVRILLCVAFAGYLFAAAVFPRTMYIDRYLLNYPTWYHWAGAQVLPSMYTTEILITAPDGKVSSVPHHPARMFWLFDQAPRCEAYNISVAYQRERGSRDFFICDGRVEFDRRP